jgi:hypothetical protein
MSIKPLRSNNKLRGTVVNAARGHGNSLASNPKVSITLFDRLKRKTARKWRNFSTGFRDKFGSARQKLRNIIENLREKFKSGNGAREEQKSEEEIEAMNFHAVPYKNSDKITETTGQVSTDDFVKVTTATEYWAQKSNRTELP